MALPLKSNDMTPQFRGVGCALKKCDHQKLVWFFEFESKLLEFGLRSVSYLQVQYELKQLWSGMKMLTWTSWSYLRVPTIFITLLSGDIACSVALGSLSWLQNLDSDSALIPPCNRACFHPYLWHDTRCDRLELIGVNLFCNTSLHSIPL